MKINALAYTFKAGSWQI